MSGYSKIKNPETNRLVNIHSKKGKKIIKKYVLYQTGGHGGPCAMGSKRCQWSEVGDEICELNKVSGRCRKKSQPKSTVSKPSSINKITLANGNDVYINILKKAQNKRREDARVDFIVTSLNDPTSVFGRRLRDEYNSGKNPNDHIASASNAGLGGCNKHYDLEITTRSGITLQCEEKSTDRKGAILNKLKPWAIAVQALNVILKGLSISDRYARLYFKFIKTLAVEYELSPPSYAHFVKDFFRPGTIENDKMLAIKEAFEKKHGKKSIQKIYADSVDSLNKEFVRTVTDIDKTQFIAHVQNKLTESFSQKHCWLQTTGLTLDYDSYMATGNFDFTASSQESRIMWSDQIVAPHIRDIKLEAVVSNKAAQLFLTYKTSTIDNPSVEYWGERTYIRLRNKFGNCSTDYK